MTRRRVIRTIAGLVYAIGGIELGIGAVLLLAADPKWDPRMMLLGGVCFLAGAKLLDRMAPPKAVRR